MKEECKLQVFKNKVLREIFGPLRDEINGEFRIMHNEELCELYGLPSKVRIVKSRRL